MDQLKRELSEATIAGIAADLSTGDGCLLLLRQLPEVDVLVNNLGIFEPEGTRVIDWQAARTPS